MMSCIKHSSVYISEDRYYIEVYQCAIICNAHCAMCIVHCALWIVQLKCAIMCNFTLCIALQSCVMYNVQLKCICAFTAPSLNSQWSDQATAALLFISLISPFSSLHLFFCFFVFYFPFHPFHLYICFHSVMHFSCSDLHSIFHFNDFCFFCHNLKFTSYSTQSCSQSLFYIARLAYRTLHNSRRQLAIMYFWYLCTMLAHFQVFLFVFISWLVDTRRDFTLFTSQASGRVAFSANLRRNATPSLHLPPPRWTKARQRWHLHFCLSFYYGLWTLLLHCICLPGGQKLDKGAHVQKTADLRPKHNKVVNQPAKQSPHGWTALNCPFWSRTNLAWI